MSCVFICSIFQPFSRFTLGRMWHDSTLYMLVSQETFDSERMYLCKHSGAKHKGGDIPVFVNSSWCKPGHVTVKERMCAQDTELLNFRSILPTRRDCLCYSNSSVYLIQSHFLSVTLQTFQQFVNWLTRENKKESPFSHMDRSLEMF